MATIVIFGGVFLIPQNVEIPNRIIPFLYTAIAYYLIQHFQGQNISSHINSGGQLYSWWRTIMIGIIALAITIIPILSFALYSDNVKNPSDSTKTYGILKHEISFDKDNISDTEVDKIADCLIKTSFFDKAVKKTIYVQKVNNNYEIYISIVNGIANDNQALQPFVDLKSQLQTFFLNNKIVLKLVVDNLDNVVKTIE